MVSRFASRPFKVAILAGAAALVFVLDVLTKAWVASTMIDHQVRIIVQGFFRLRYTQNTGAAFGLFQGWTGALSVVAVAIIAALVLSASRVASSHPAIMVALGLVLGGALGNLYDRLALGYVRDFIEVYGPRLQIGNTVYTFPVFNVADSGITVGVVIIMAILLFSGDEGAPRKEGVASSEL